MLKEYAEFWTDSLLCRQHRLSTVHLALTAMPLVSSLQLLLELPSAWCSSESSKNTLVSPFPIWLISWVNVQQPQNSSNALPMGDSIYLQVPLQLYFNYYNHSGSLLFLFFPFLLKKNKRLPYPSSLAFHLRLQNALSLSLCLSLWPLYYSHFAHIPCAQYSPRLISFFFYFTMLIELLQNSGCTPFQSLR